ncbi:MAG: transporter substrate-binding domain-containing protein [Clostridia bacterium]|nr:transporter substrate-binding domain-containing protein [Clostridia bacterium]
MKTPRFALCILFSVVLLVSASGSLCFAEGSTGESATVLLTPEEQQFIKDHPVIKLGVDPSFIPYEFFDGDGKYKGIAADYIDLICDKTGLNMVVTNGLTWTQAYEQAVKKELDVLPCVVKTDERSKYFLFSEPYVSFQRVIFVRKDNTDIKTFVDLAGKSVAVQKNSSHNSFLKEFRDISLSLYPTVPEALEALSEGKEVAFVGNLATSNYLIESMGISNLKYVDIDIDEDEQVYFAVRNDWPLLVGIINKGLAAITEEEKITIRDRWLGVKNEVDYSKIWEIGGAIGGVILLVLVISVFWIIRLRKEVQFRKRVQDELRIAKEYAETANQVKSAFLARMSHEIRTPLNAITGFAYLAKKSDNSSTQLLYLDKITDSSRSMLGIINDILDFSKMEAGKITIERISFDLDKVIQQVISTNYIRVEEQGIGFSVDKDPGIPSFFWGDPTRIEQVLTNLISNAAKFTSKGSVSLSVNLIGKDDRLFDLEFSVADTGIGMSEDQIAQLFKPFEQADSSISRRFGGSGLGLSIVKNLVELMGGSVSVKSEEGKGSTFKVRLSLEADQAQENENKAKSLGLMFRNIRALLIDSDATNSYLIKKYLTSFGIDIEAVTSEREAIGLIEKAAGRNEITYNLIIIDHATPKGGGIECWKRLKNLPLYREAPKAMLLIPFNRQDLFDSLGQAEIDLGVTIPIIPSVMYDGIVEIFKTRVLDHHTPSSVQNNNRVAHPYRVLIVEDNKTNQFISKTILEQAGFLISIAENGQEGYEKYSRDRNIIDVILMDLHMPVMNGYDSTELIRKLDQEIPIVAMTADAISGVEDRCRSLGINHFVSKPFDPDTFVSDIVNIVTASGSLPKAFSIGLAENSVNMTDKESHDTEGFGIPESKVYSPLNEEDGLKLLGGNVELYHEVLKAYRAENADLIKELSSQIESGNFSAASKTVHKIKGSSGNIGAKSLYAIASKLQRALEDKSAEVGELFEEFRQLFEQVMLYLSKLD